MHVPLNLAFTAALAAGGLFAAQPATAASLSPMPPMGWNDWAHYQCNFTVQTVLDNARALVASGLGMRPAAWPSAMAFFAAYGGCWRGAETAGPGWA